MTRLPSVVGPRLLAGLLVFAAVLCHEATAAQALPAAAPGSSERTREDLEKALATYEQVLLSPAYSDAIRENAQVRIERIRRRLIDGDFRLGDRIALVVQGEADLPDTVAVQAGPLIVLPPFGDISLAGVLRSEVETHLTQALARFIRMPVVQAKALMRVSVQGAVGRPGFYVVPADMLLSETLMIAGGPAPNSNLDQLRVDRGQEALMEGAEVGEAVRQGLTLDQLNLEAGDQLFVPERSAGLMSNVGIIAGLVGTLGFLILQLAN